MGFFETVEHVISGAANFAGNLLKKVEPATKGWGANVDRWMDEKVNPTVETVTSKTTEVVSNTVDTAKNVWTDFNKKHPTAEPQVPEPTIQPEPVPVPVPVSDTTTPVNEVVEPEEVLVVEETVVEDVPVEYSLTELREQAKALGLKGTSNLRKPALIEAIAVAKAQQNNI